MLHVVIAQAAQISDPEFVLGWIRKNPVWRAEWVYQKDGFGVASFYKKPRGMKLVSEVEGNGIIVAYSTWVELKDRIMVNPNRSQPNMYLVRGE